MKQSEVVHALVYIQPATTEEIAQAWDQTRNAADTAVGHLYHRGALLRNRRASNCEKVPDYQYRLNPDPDLEEYHD